MSACVSLAPTGRDTGQHQLPEASSSTPQPRSSQSSNALTHSLTHFCTSVSANPRLSIPLRLSVCRRRQSSPALPTTRV